MEIWREIYERLKRWGMKKERIENELSDENIKGKGFFEEEVNKKGVKERMVYEEIEDYIKIKYKEEIMN